jgi:hypothetical protein
MTPYKTEINWSALKYILEKINEPTYVVFGSHKLSEDQIKTFEDLDCKYEYIEPKFLCEPEDYFYIVPSKILNDYCWKLEDYYE